MVKVRGLNNVPKNKSHHAWKGNSVGHSSLHAWIRNEYGNAYKCENKYCDNSSSVFEWANISGKYLRERNDFKMLCRKCHSIMDKGIFCKNGHRRTNENTKIQKSGYRRCLICYKLNREEYKPRRNMLRRTKCQ
jgi:hypothetical protein